MSEDVKTTAATSGVEIGVEKQVEKLARMQRKARKTIFKILDGLVRMTEDLEHTETLKGSCGSCTGCYNGGFEENSVRVADNLAVMHYNTCYRTPAILYRDDNSIDNIDPRLWKILAFTDYNDEWRLNRAVGKAASILVHVIEEAPEYIRRKGE